MSQTGFFTKGVSWCLPHPAVSARSLLKIHEVVAHAFALLRKCPPLGFQLSTASEEEITRQLHWVIENRLFKKSESPRFDRRIFRNVVHNAEITNYDWKHPAKKPDLAFFLRRETLSVMSTHDAIFAECKPVDSNHGVEAHYCKLGIARFVIGDYAWTMREGLMIGYARKRTIEQDLFPALSRCAGALGNPRQPRPVRNSVPQGVETLHYSDHSRSFRWPNEFGPACEIRLFHSWHSCE